MYTSDATPDEQSMFITEKHCFSDLVSGLATPCPCGMTRAPWTLESVVQVCMHAYANMARNFSTISDLQLCYMNFTNLIIVT